MAQPRPALEDGLENHRRGVPVLNFSAVDNEADQEATCVGDDVALAAFDLFPSVKAPYSAAFRGFDALILSLPKDGCQSRPLTGWSPDPSFPRSSITRALFIACQSPQPRHW